MADEVQGTMCTADAMREALHVGADGTRWCYHEVPRESCVACWDKKVSAAYSAGMRAGEIARWEKFATMNFAYDKSADVLYVTFGKSAPEECKFAENANGDILRIHRQTEQIVGVTIISFFSRIQKGAIEVLPLPAAPEEKK